MDGRGRLRRLAHRPEQRRRPTRSTGSGRRRWRPSWSSTARPSRASRRPSTARAALATRENSCYSGERPGNRGLFHTGCGGGPDGRRRVQHLLDRHRDHGGRRGELRAARRRRSSSATRARTPRRSSASRPLAGRRTSSRARCRRSSPPTRRTASVGTPPNIDRCWTCRSMFMQAWGHYGTAWSVVHQGLGVRPDLGHGPAGDHAAGARRAAAAGRRTSGSATGASTCRRRTTATAT